MRAYTRQPAPCPLPPIPSSKKVELTRIFWGRKRTGAGDSGRGHGTRDTFGIDNGGVASHDSRVGEEGERQREVSRGKGREGKGREAGQSNAMGIKFTLVSK